MYFRFYDPRVLRDFYAIATPRQRADLCMGLDEVVVESEEGAPLALAGHSRTEPAAAGA